MHDDLDQARTNALAAVRRRAGINTPDHVLVRLHIEAPSGPGWDVDRLVPLAAVDAGINQAATIDYDDTGMTVYCHPYLFTVPGVTPLTSPAASC